MNLRVFLAAVHQRMKLPLRLALLVAIAFFGESYLSAEAPNVSCDEARRMQLSRDNTALVDARLPTDFVQGHIQGAVNAPAGELGASSVPKNRRLVVYCPEISCALAETSAQKLRGLGYSDVAILEGGLAEWVRKGYPIEVGQPVTVARTKPGRISAEVARDKIAVSELVVVDVRPGLEFAAGHIPGARNMPLETFAAELAVLPKGKDVLVYDRQAGRSRKAAMMLIESGYRVFELPGGLAGWLKKKYPLEVK